MSRLLLIVTLLTCNVLCSAEYKSWHGYRVTRLQPTSNTQIQWTKSMRDDNSLDFWSPSDVMVGPDRIKSFTQQLAEKEIPWSILIHDVQKTVAKERAAQLLHMKTRGQSTSISFDTYHRYDEIQKYLQQLSSRYTGMVKLGSIGNTNEGRNITYITISRDGPVGDNSSPIILVEGGIHAREWISPAMALYIIQQLVENPRNKDLTNELTWIIIPLLNPDGYEYTHTTERFWRKNRSKHNQCYGVDLNRNFAYHWMGDGASSGKCSATYGGPKPFSEPETEGMANLMLGQKGRLHMYISLHSYGQYILYPWCYTKSSHPNDAHLEEVAVRANAVQENSGGWSYRVGSTSNTLYLAAGCSKDWVTAAAGVPFAYTVELPGGGKRGFDLPASDISHTVSSFFPAIRVFAVHVAHPFYTGLPGLAIPNCSTNINYIVCFVLIVIQATILKIFLI